MNFSGHAMRFTLLPLLINLLVFTQPVSADDYGQGHHRRARQHYGSNHHRDRNLRAVDNAAYTARCGGCHFAYQPELLPAASWEKILEGTRDHFGATVDISEDERLEIRKYLASNAADRSSARLAGKIMRCLGSRAPLRITDIPLIRREHHEISPQTFQRRSVGSLSNCIACHRAAENGVYDDDQVSIPD